MLNSSIVSYRIVLYVYFTALCFSHVEVRFDISVIKELIDWLIVSYIPFARIKNIWFEKKTSKYPLHGRRYRLDKISHG